MDTAVSQHRFTRSMALQAACFGIYFFAFLLTETIVNDYAAMLFGAKYVTLIYSIGILCTALGYLSFSLSRRLLRQNYGRRGTLLLAGLISVWSAVGIVFAQEPSLFLFFSFAALLSFGHIGAFIHYSLSLLFADSPFLGRTVGISAGAGVLLQFLVQSIPNKTIPFITSLVLSVLFLFYWVLRPPKDWVLENPLPREAVPRTDAKVALFLTSAVVLLTAIYCINDSLVVSMHARGQVDLFGISRLVYAASLVIAGFLADVKNRRILPLVTACTQLFSITAPLLTSDPAWHSFNMVLIYFYGGFYVIFFTVTFLAFAPSTKRPELWAGMGRIARSLTTAIVVCPLQLLFERFGIVPLTMLSCVFVVFLIITLLGTGFPGNSNAEADTTLPDSVPCSEEEYRARYALRLALTPREADILTLLVDTEESVQEIADSLYMSRRTCQRYIAAIYEKAGVKSRMGLYQSYISDRQP